MNVSIIKRFDRVKKVEFYLVRVMLGLQSFSNRCSDHSEAMNSAKRASQTLGLDGFTAVNGAFVRV